MKNKYKRRTFIKTAGAGMAGAGLLSTSSCSPGENFTIKDMFIHHVFFWLKQPGTQEVRNKFEQALKDLVTVETIVDFHLGVPAPTNREVIDTTYSYSLLTLFKNKEDQDIYQTHPKHLKFIEDCQDLWERVVVYDTISI
ncbi:MAG: Dabb family protein [Bacteroidales bacterium]|nr:Dabb family protein [Bacteroidales bacterium]